MIRIHVFHSTNRNHEPIEFVHLYIAIYWNREHKHSFCRKHELDNFSNVLISMDDFSGGQTKLSNVFVNATQGTFEKKGTGNYKSEKKAKTNFFARLHVKKQKMLC